MQNKLTWQEKLKELNKKELFQALSKIYTNPLSDKDFQIKYKATRDEMRKEIVSILKKYYPNKKEIQKNIKQHHKKYIENISETAHKTFTISIEDFIKEMGV